MCKWTPVQSWQLTLLKASCDKLEHRISLISVFIFQDLYPTLENVRESQLLKESLWAEENRKMLSI